MDSSLNMPFTIPNSYLCICSSGMRLALSLAALTLKRAQHADLIVQSLSQQAVTFGRI